MIQSQKINLYFTFYSPKEEYMNFEQTSKVISKFKGNINDEFEFKGVHNAEKFKKKIKETLKPGFSTV